MKVSVSITLILLSFASIRAGEESAVLQSSRNARQAVEEWVKLEPAKRPELATQPFASMPLTRGDAEEIRKLLGVVHAQRVMAERSEEWRERKVRIGTNEMRFDVRTFGAKPANGRSLYLSLHGGGSTPQRVNDRQWENQKRLYSPAEGLYIAPRAPTDSWDMWHKPPVDKLLERIVADAIVFEGVDPDRVYLTGYSAGGDGLYRLAPRLADRWAAAAMMAGHPGEASPLSLRNLPFAIHVGEKDSAYDRNKRAMEWGKKLDELRSTDPDGYEHEVELHTGKGHWMDRQDAKAIAWMATHSRQPWPKKIVWKPDAASRPQFYWLSVPAGSKLAGSQVTAAIEGQRVILRTEGLNALTLRLSDELLDLDKPVTIELNGKTAYGGVIRRTAATIVRSLAEREDLRLTATAEISVGENATNSAKPGNP